MALRTANYSTKTIQDREGVLRRLAWWLDQTHGVGLRHTNPVTLGEWQETINLRSLETRRAYTCHVRAFYGWMAQFTEVNPAVLLKPPRMPRREPRPMDEKTVAYCLRALTEPERTWFVLGAFQGLRAGEIAALDREDIRDDGKPTLVLIHGKGAKERLIPLHPLVWELLRKHIAGPGGLWRRPQGGPATGKYISERANHAFRRLGLGYTLHSCRHRAGTMAYRTSLDIRAVQELLGHESLRSTQIYTAVAPAAISRALAGIVEPLAEARKRPPPKGGASWVPEIHQQVDSL